MSSNVKSKKKVNALKTTKKNTKSSNEIPVNQKHQIISIKQFGDYNYDTRRSQWHKLAGHNEEQEVCVICKDDDNWATVEVENGAHICYFCWVKKPTAETKKIIATAKRITPKSLPSTGSNNLIINRDNSKNIGNGEILKISKFIDEKGISYRNTDEVQNYKTDKNTIDKTSRYGVSPAVYYDSTINYKKPHDKLCVVRPYDNFLMDSARYVELYANLESKEAIDEFHRAVLKAKLTTKKNLMAAKVNSLRYITKAILLEKNDREQKNEVIRHEEAIQTIHEIRQDRLEKNELELANDLNNVNLRYERDLKRNEDKLIKRRNNIEKQILINNLKIERQKEKVMTLASGQDYKRTSIWKEVNQIRFNRSVPRNIPLSQEIDSIASLVKKFESIDPTRLSQEERDVVVKFLRLVDSNNRQENYMQQAAEYRTAINEMNKKISSKMKKDNKHKKKTNENEAMIVSYSTYKKIINAKKETLSITMPINKLQQAGIKVKTKTIKVDKPDALKGIDNSRAMVKIKPQKMQFEKMEYLRLDDELVRREIERTIGKFKNIVRNASAAERYDVSPYGINAYKIDYVGMKYTKYQIKYKKSWKDFFRSNKAQPNRFDANSRYVTLQDFNNQNQSKFSSLFKPKLNDNGEPIPRGFNKLRKLLESLPSDPVVSQNNGLFEQERIDLMRAIANLKQMEISYNLTQEQVDSTLNEVNRILDLYYKITKADANYANNIQLSQIEDEKLMNNIRMYDQNIATNYARADYKYNDKLQRIKERYARNIENAHNQHLLRIEYIYEQEQNSLNKEEQQHLWNQAALYEGNNKIANNQYAFQNSIINATVKEINKFNATSNDPISLDDVPACISKLPITSNETIKLLLSQVEDKVLVKANSGKKNDLVVAKALNKKVPENVTTIYVLDKYRNIPDLNTRVPLLTEYAKKSYEAAIEYNKQREAKEIAIAKEVLENKLKAIDVIYADAQTLKIAADRMQHIIDEGRWVQANYENMKNEKWKIHDKAAEYERKLKVLEQKNEARQLKLIQKQENIYERRKLKALNKNKKHETIDYHEVIGSK